MWVSFFSITTFFLLFKCGFTQDAFEPWGNWSECSTTCGFGVRLKTRTCPGDVQCSVDQIGQLQLCKLRECPIDGGWSSWSPWSRCSKSCGNNSTQRRGRPCDSPPPQHGGRPCDGDYVESRGCEDLLPCPVHGGWSDWSSWSNCTARLCRMKGRQFRSRECNDPAPSHGGSNCPGKKTTNRRCSKPGCHVDGGWSDWSEWSTCSVQCGSDGVETSTRLCNNPPPKRRGRPCTGSHSRTRSCVNLDPCPDRGEFSSSVKDLLSEGNGLVNAEPMNSGPIPIMNDMQSEQQANDAHWWSLSSSDRVPATDSAGGGIELSFSSSDAETQTDSFDNSFSDAASGSRRRTTTTRTRTTTTTEATTSVETECVDAGSGSSYSTVCR